jgi:hypothetical protein
MFKYNLEYGVGRRRSVRRIVGILSFLIIAQSGHCWATTLSAYQVAQYAYNAGFRDLGNDRGIITAVAIAGAESSFRTDAINYNNDTYSSVDRGLWQINSYWHREVSPTCAFDPACSASQVYRISVQGTRWTEWNSYLSGTYVQWLPIARSAVASLSQSGTAKAKMTSPVNGSTFSSSTVTFYWTAGTGVSQYFIYVGNSTGANDIYSANTGQSLSQTVYGIPTDGRTIYVRLWSYINGSWQFNDYTYRAFTSSVLLKATIYSPGNGAQLSSSSATFLWSSASGVIQYYIYLGSNQGATDLWSGSLGLSTAITFNGLPHDGRMLWIRLWTQTSAGWQYSDSYYFAARY